MSAGEPPTLTLTVTLPAHEWEVVLRSLAQTSAAFGKMQADQRNCIALAHDQGMTVPRFHAAIARLRDEIDDLTTRLALILKHEADRVGVGGEPPS